MMTLDEFKQLTYYCRDLSQIFRECAFKFGESIDIDMDGVYHIWYKDGSILHIDFHTGGVIDFHFQSNRKKGEGENYYEWKCSASWHMERVR